MDVKIINIFDFSELEKKIRQVPLKKRSPDDPEIKIYRNARISLKNFYAEEVNPTSFYLLQNGIERQKELRHQLLKKYNIDTLSLKGALDIQNEKGEIWTLTPPIVEATPRRIKYQAQPQEIPYEETFKITIPIINDGLHRVYIARETNEPFNAIFISGALEDFPFYAHPNEWDRVKIFENVPKTPEEKKLYSRKDCYDLYRDFGVLGCGAPRGTSK